MFQKIQDYLNSRLLLLKLEISEKTAEALAVLFSRIVLLAFILLLISFCSLTMAFAISEFYDSYVIGFGVISGFYFIITVVMLIFSKQILENPFMNKLIKIFFRQSDGKRK